MHVPVESAMIGAQGGLALVGILRYFKVQSEGGTPASRRRRRLAELWSSLNSETLDAGAAYEAALEYAGLISVEETKRAALIVTLSERRDILKYGVGGSVLLTQSEKDRLLETLRNLSSKTLR